MGEGLPSHARFKSSAQVKSSPRHDDARPFCAVIGAGPAGLFAAETLARAGARVTVFDHKPSPARKFLMAGRGGLNITHSEPLERFITRYGVGAPFLSPLIRAWPPQALRDFCAELGEPTFVGSSGRVFPASFKASPLLRAWLARLARLGVVIAPRHSFRGFAGKGVLRMSAPDGDEILLKVDAIILAMGGASWPRLGSDGGWVKTLADAGVAIHPLQPANAGLRVAWSDLYRADFEGQPIKNVTIRHQIGTARGDMVVTRSGLEGGPVYTLFLASRIADTTRLRATVATVILVSALVRLLLFTGSGFLYESALPALAAALLPCALAGYLMGSRLHLRMPQAQVRRVIWMVLVAAAVSLLARGTMGLM